MKPSGKVALGGVFGALSLMFMLMTFFPLGTYALPAIAGVLLIPVVVEAGAKTAWMVYAAVALLSLLIAPDMEAKVLFLAFFGYYPVLKAHLEKLRRRVVEWLIKLGVFNAAMVLSYLVMLFVFHLDPETFVVGGVNVALLFLLAGNVIFVIYDYALSNLVTVYYRALHPRLSRIFHMNRR